MSRRVLLTGHLPLCSLESVQGCGFCYLLLTSVMTPLHDHPRHLGLVSAFWVHHDCCAARRLSGSEIWHLHLGQGCGWELVGRVENCFWHLGLSFGFSSLLMCRVSFWRSFESYWSFVLQKEPCTNRDVSCDICFWVLSNLEHSGRPEPMRSV